MKPMTVDDQLTAIFAEVKRQSAIAFNEANERLGEMAIYAPYTTLYIEAYRAERYRIERGLSTIELITLYRAATRSANEEDGTNL